MQVHALHLLNVLDFRSFSRSGECPDRKSLVRCIWLRFCFQVNLLLIPRCLCSRSNLVLLIMSIVSSLLFNYYWVFCFQYFLYYNCSLIGFDLFWRCPMALVTSFTFILLYMAKWPNQDGHVYCKFYQILRSYLKRPQLYEL